MIFVCDYILLKYQIQVQSSHYKKSFGNEFKFSISSAARPIVASGLVEPCTLHRSQKQLQVIVTTA